MTALPAWVGSDQFDDLETKYNNLNTKFNALATLFENLTAGQVLRQIDGTDFNMESIYVPRLESSSSPALVINRKMLGDWNMNSDDSITIAHGLDATQWKTITIIGGTIRNDADSTYYPMWRSGAGATDVSVFSIDSTNITVSRRTSSIFDDAAFDNVGYNRGFLYYTYTP